MSKKLPDVETMYNALVRKDSSYEGLFFAAVKTTGIFCRPTCPVKKPKRENVEFFGSASEALQHGYRPCKVCGPLAHLGETPMWLRPLLDEVSADPGIRLKDKDIRRRGVDPNRVRRWFRKHHGMTFQGYLRTLRIGQAFGRIRYGSKVIDAAFDSGYESLSGFGESFRSHTGFSPHESTTRNLIMVTRISTPLGPMLAGAGDRGICLLEFTDRKKVETQFKQLSHRLHAACIQGSHDHFTLLDKQLKEYFAGTRQTFNLPLLLAGTPFQRAVWEGLRKIPYGTTRSYQEQAQFLNRPTAVRAVARANGDNPLAIIIPCHRVIGKDGKLVGYGGGLWRKRYLLDHERRHRYT